MYSPDRLQHTSGGGAGVVYVQRLRENLQELQAAKKMAISSEDYASANQLKDKIAVVQSQINRVEDQFTTDILQNCITAWHNELASAIQDRLNGNLKMTSFLHLRFHENFVNIIKGAPLSFYDSLIRAIIIFMPHELPDISKSPYGWDNFARKIQASSVKTQDSIDSIKSSVVLSIMDVISIAIGRSKTTHVKKDTYDITLRYIFNYIHNVASRRMNHDVEGPIFDKAFSRCACVIGYIAGLKYVFCADQINWNSNFRDIFRFAMSHFEKKVSPEEIALVISLMKYSFFPATNVEESVEITEYLKDLQSAFDKAKKNVVKIAVVQLIEQVIQPLQMSSSSRGQMEALLWAEVSNVYKKAKKWCTVDELKPATLSLMAIILVNSRIDFFASNIDSFINTELCPKNKVREYAYAPILQLLRGRYFEDTLKNLEDSLNDTYANGRYFASSTRGLDEQTHGTVSNRLNVIAIMMLFQKKGPIPDDRKGIAVYIVAQMAAYSITFGAKIISQLLDTTRVGNTADCFFIGIKALRVILDFDSGFQTFAVSKSDPEFQAIIQDFPYDMTSCLSSIFSYVNELSGPHVAGTSGKIVELVRPSDSAQTIQGSSDNFNSSIAQQVFLPGAEDSSPSGTSNSFLATVGSVGNLSLRRSTSLGAQLAEQGSALISSSPTIEFPLLSNSRPSSESNLTANVASFETDESISKTITSWFAKLGSPLKSPEKYSNSSSLIDKARLKKKNLKYEQLIALGILEEFLPIIKFAPSPEFIGGKYFIGTFLNHSVASIGTEVAITLIETFKNYPDLRLGIVNGFINFLKTTPHRDEISICSNLEVFSSLIKIWSDEVKLRGELQVQPDGFFKVSCKVDAIVMLLMSHPNFRTRALSLQILFDFNAIEKLALPMDLSAGEIPLAAILESYEHLIIKQGIYGFLESGFRGVDLSSKIASSFTPLAFADVARSSYTGLFRFYHGELAKMFSFYGRPKATRHLAKHLKIYAVPLIEQTFPTANDEFKSLFTSYMNLMTALAGIQLKSDVVSTPRPKTAPEPSLPFFASFKSLIPYLLTIEKTWETKALLNSFYFLHRDVVQVLVHELMQCFQEVRLNSTTFSTTRFLLNLFTLLRAVIQYPHFILLIEGDAKFAVHLIQMYSDFISVACTAEFSESEFILKGNIPRMKAAIDISIIVHRLSYCLNTVGRKLLRQARFDENEEPFRIFDGAKWQAAQRRPTVFLFKLWYQAAALDDAKEKSKHTSLKKKLIHNVSLAVTQLMLLGELFPENKPLPPGILLWLITIESQGYRVFVPDFLINFEDALVTVLGSSYCAKDDSPYFFCEAIFDQMMPRLDDGVHMYLFGTSRRMSFAEPYISFNHTLPQANPADLDTPAFVYPETSTSGYEKIRRNLGALLFFGLYNLMSTSCDVRLRSFLFLKELIITFNPEESSDIESYLKEFNGKFYSSTPIFLKEKVIRLSSTCSNLFAEFSGSFLWEAVRCACNTRNSKALIMKPKDWVMELVMPWCKFVDIGSINVSDVNAEFFKFLMDCAFDEDSSHEDIVNCWIEVSRSNDFGIVNASVLMDAVIEISSRFPSLQSSSLLLASALFSTQPELVSSKLTFQLSSAAFPWNQSANSLQHASQTAIREYISTLHSKLGINAPESENGYRLNCKSAAYLISQILPQRFDYFFANTPVLLNYIIVKLDGPLKNSTVLQGCINGFVAFLHSSNLIDDEKFRHEMALVRKFLGWLAMENAQVSWSPHERTVTDISISEFLELLIEIFAYDNPNLRTQIIEELAKWASEGFLGHDETIRSIKGYRSLLLPKIPLPIQTKYPDFLFPRLLDQISILQQLELEAKQIAKLSNVPSGWTSLPKGKLLLKANAEEVILEILNLHSVLLRKFKENNTIEKQGKLFWVTFGFLYLPKTEFPKIISLAMENALYMLENAESERMDPYFLFPLDSTNTDSCHMQHVLCPYIFSDSPNFDSTSLMILLMARLKLPGNTVDSGKPGMMYTLLYVLTFIFVRIAKNDLKGSLFLKTLLHFKTLLSVSFQFSTDVQQELKNSQDKIRNIQQLRNGIHRLIELCANTNALSKETQQSLLNQCFGNLVDFYCLEYGNNLSTYAGHILTISPHHRYIGVRILFNLWKSPIRNAKRDLGLDSIEHFVLSLPFIMDSDSNTEDLILHSFQALEISNIIKEVDVVSHGKTLSLPEPQFVEGTAKSSWHWLSKELRLSPSKPFYSL